jgi:hypothetical protein
MATVDRFTYIVEFTANYKRAVERDIHTQFANTTAGKVQS